jgi:hypothetical protein
MHGRWGAFPFERTGASCAPTRLGILAQQVRAPALGSSSWRKSGSQQARRRQRPRLRHPEATQDLSCSGGAAFLGIASVDAAEILIFIRMTDIFSCCATHFHSLASQDLGTRWCHVGVSRSEKSVILCFKSPD